MAEPTVTISIDLELAWGVWDAPTPGHIRFAEEAERPIVSALLGLFERHEVRATWAMVAALLDDTAQGDLPGPCAAWYAPDLVEAVSAAEVGHEIASHSGRHVYFDRIDRAAAGADLDYARALHASHGLGFQSFVFPRNAVGHLQAVAEAGLRVFRGPDRGVPALASRIGGPARRAINLAEKMLPIPPSAVSTEDASGLTDLPGSMLLIGRNGPRRFVLPSVTRAKLSAGIRAAQRSGACFHLWFHPSNFYHRRDEQLATLDWFLGLVSRERAAGRLEVRTMAMAAPKSAAA